MAGIQNACCPSPDGQKLTYIQPGGYFWNNYTNKLDLLDASAATGFDPSLYFNKCAITQYAPVAYGPAYDPIPCPCCPEHYHYANWRVWDSSTLATPCQSMFVPYEYVGAVDCITCVCEDVQVAAPRVCTTCDEQGGQPITFSYNPFINHCACCKAVDNSVLPSDTPCLNKFLPYFMVLPNIPSPPSQVCRPVTNLAVTFTSPTPAFTMTWTPSGGAAGTQTAKGKHRAEPTWFTNSPLFNPANPLSPTATTTFVNNPAGNIVTNRVYQFQVDTACPSGVQSSPIVEAICYACPVITRSYSSGVISASIPVVYSVDQVIFSLYKDGVLFGAPQIVSGNTPNVTFSGITTGHTYNVHVEMKTLINGTTMVSSTDAGQLGAVCTSVNLVI